MKAMILAAGLGTRLKPLTDKKPKALVEIDGVPLLEYVIRHLKRNRIREIIINVHHFSEQIVDFLIEKNNFNINIEISDEKGRLLNTGGGLKHAEWFLNDGNDFLVYNVDVISDINLNALIDFHKKNEALATLAVRSRKTSRYFLFNQKNMLCGWKNMATNEIRIQNQQIQKIKPLAFSGIQVLNSSVFKYINQQPETFSITDFYVNICNSSKIIGFAHDRNFWMDLGTPEKLNEANRILSKFNFLLYND